MTQKQKENPFIVPLIVMGIILLIVMGIILFLSGLMVGVYLADAHYMDIMLKNGYIKYTIEENTGETSIIYLDVPKETTKTP